MRILLHTTSPVLARGFTMIHDGGDGFQPLALSGDIAEIVAKVSEWQPHVVMLDTASEVDFSLITALTSQVPTCKVVLWVYSISVEMAHRARAMGVRGVLRKDLSVELLVRCLMAVAAGELWFDRALLNAMLQVREVRLSPRERQLLQLITLGFSNKMIADELEISEGTVKVYLAKLFRKVAVHDRYELALHGLRASGLTPSVTGARSAFSSSLILQQAAAQR